MAWLSVALLAAAWGAEVGRSWQTVWLHGGLLGLVSAVGLSYASRAVQARQAAINQAHADARLAAAMLLQAGEHTATVGYAKVNAPAVTS